MRKYYIKSKDTCFTVKLSSGNYKTLNYQPVVQDMNVVFDLVSKYKNKDIHIKTTKGFSKIIKENEPLIKGFCKENNLGFTIHYETEYVFEKYTHPNR